MLFLKTVKVKTDSLEPAYAPFFVFMLSEVGGAFAPGEHLFEMMFDLVVTKEVGPFARRPRWPPLFKIITECCSTRWQGRLTSYKARKLLDEISI